MTKAFDLFSTEESDVLAIQPGFVVHGCNALGVMGAGVARGVAAKFPAAFNVYRESLHAGNNLGTISVAQVDTSMWIVNAITQSSVGGGKQIDDSAIMWCFRKVSEFADIVDPARNIPIRFPKIGAGLGGGDWGVISANLNFVIDEMHSARDREINRQKRKYILHVPAVVPQDCR